MWDTVYFVQTADVVTQDSDCGGNCKMTELQSAGRCSAVACSSVAGRRSCDVLIQHQEVLSKLVDWFWLWYLSFVWPWGEDCGRDVTQFATFRRYQLPPSSQCKIGNSFSWTSLHFQCTYSRTLYIFPYLVHIPVPCTYSRTLNIFPYLEPWYDNICT